MGAGEGGGRQDWGWVRRVGKEDQKAYNYLSNFKMQIPCLWPCWDQIFHYHLSGKSPRGEKKMVKLSFPLHEVFCFGLV